MTCKLMFNLRDVNPRMMFVPKYYLLCEEMNKYYLLCEFGL